MRNDIRMFPLPLSRKRVLEADCEALGDGVGIRVRDGGDTCAGGETGEDGCWVCEVPGFG